MIRPYVLLTLLFLTGVACFGQSARSQPPATDSVSSSKTFIDGVSDGFKASAKADTGTVNVGKNGGMSGAYWRFKTGDDIRWANPAYNDRAWQPKVSPADPLNGNKLLWQSGKGWFRLRFRLHPKLLANEPTLVVDQTGRSEVYLDGKRLAVLGTTEMDTIGMQRLIRFIALPITDTTAHVLAVRYSLRRDAVVKADFDEGAFSMKIQSADLAPVALLVTQLVQTGSAFLLTGIFGTLALLHFLFYRANKTQKVNKLLGWEMLAFSVSYATRRLDDFTATLTTNSVIDTISELMMHVGLAFLLTAIYRYLNLKYNWWYYTVVGLLGLTPLYRFFVGIVPYELDSLVYLVLGIEYLRVSWIGRRRKDAYSRLPWVSIRTALYCLLTLLVVMIVIALIEVVKTGSGDININLGWLSGVLFVTTMFGLLSFPVGLSLSLVQDYGRTYRSLGDKLKEVEALSARTLMQEQEKQALLAQQNETLERLVLERTAALDQSLTDLRATQDQLIQREKLASLGELTAGVAHEIQNPLNFVNNFSEVSVELITELEEEQARAVTDRDEGLEREIMADIKQNVSKINEHGKRAASIVRGMLQHSRASTGQREATNLNALADEYLKLAYHGLRANDKSFDVSLVTHYDPALPTVSVVPSDIGRVLMNLLTNAFHAVRDRSAQARQQGIDYKPTVTLTTEHEAGQVRIRVHDNGLGIPDSVRSKIFQPFFTTKPTGQGTGLGLSISYDIVTKGHGGTIGLESEPNNFTEFVVELPA
ncbi:ATP-binding protein [Fibrella sp. WM1]|uniref:ATP-binding protein n=1 Tax=Fibrella musci TaxID=3242485 RepID=UPI00352068E2